MFLKKWKHLLNGRHVILKTDKKSVQFIFNTQNHEKIKIKNSVLENQFFFLVWKFRGKENMAVEILM